jgi:integrase/recombinase XerD
MAKKRRKTPEPIGDPNDPQGMIVMFNRFLESMRVKNFSDETIAHRDYYGKYFIRWCEERGVVRPGEVNKPILERYQRFMFHYRKKNGEPLSFRTQQHHLVVLRMWFKFLARNNFILYNPASELELPKLEYRLPKHILTASETDQIINQADADTPLGIRDRAIMETFYSTGMRRKELIRLKVYDLDRERGTVMIRQGKGKKDRMIPIGDRALAWIDRYVQEVRPGLLFGDLAGDVMFLTELGEPFSPNQLTNLVRTYIRTAEIGKQGSCHLLRHTMATLMLENGSDIRFVQAMLGHARLDTTMIYTRVSIRKLKEIRTATHPAKLKRTDRSGKPKPPVPPPSDYDDENEE